MKMDLLVNSVGIIIVGFIGYTLWNEVLKMKKEREQGTGGTQNVQTIQTKNVHKPKSKSDNGDSKKKESQDIFRKLEESFK